MPGVYDHMISKNNSGGLILGALYQPLFLYESFFNIMLFLIIYLFMPFFKEIKAGVISGSYFLGYGIIRMITESMRDNNFKNTETFIMNGILLGAGLIIIIYSQFINNWLRNYKVWKIFIDSNKNWVNKIRLNNLNNKLSKNEISKNDFNLRIKDIQIVEKFNLNYIKQNYKKVESEMCFYDER